MPRKRVYLPEGVFLRLQALEQSQRYVAELTAEVGEPTDAQLTHAWAVARRIRDR